MKLSNISSYTQKATGLTINTYLLGRFAYCSAMSDDNKLNCGPRKWWIFLKKSKFNWYAPVIEKI